MELKIIPVVQVAIALILMTLLQHFLPYLNYSALVNSFISVTAALILLFLALAIGIFSLYSFNKHQTTVNPTKPETSSKIVDSGIYRYSRNPMYLAMLLGLLAYACYLENPLAFVICGLFVIYIRRYQIVPEERMLTTLFGQAYRDYQQQVRRWL